MHAGPKFKWKLGAAGSSCTRTLATEWLESFSYEATSSEGLVPAARINLSGQQFKRRRNRDFENNEIYCHCGRRLALPLPTLTGQSYSVRCDTGRLSEAAAAACRNAAVNSANRMMAVLISFLVQGGMFGWMASKFRVVRGSHWIKRYIKTIKKTTADKLKTNGWEEKRKSSNVFRWACREEKEEEWLRLLYSFCIERHVFFMRWKKEINDQMQTGRMARTNAENIRGR